MSDAQTIYRLGLALGCALGAWVLKFSSGVGDVVSGNSSHDADHVCRGRSGIRNSRVGVGGAMKGKNGTAYRTEPGSNVLVVDFAHLRAVNDMRKRMHDLGVFSGVPDGKVK